MNLDSALSNTSEGKAFEKAEKPEKPKRLPTMSSNDFYRMMMEAHEDVSAIKERYPNRSNSKIINLITSNHRTEVDYDDSLAMIEEEAHFAKTMSEKNRVSRLEERSNSGSFANSMKNVVSELRNGFRSLFSKKQPAIAESEENFYSKITRSANDSESYANLPNKTITDTQSPQTAINIGRTGNPYETPIINNGVTSLDKTKPVIEAEEA